MKQEKALTKAWDLPKEVLNLFDQFVHGDIDRRGFLEKASKYAAGGLTAAAMLDFLSPNYALAQQVKENDERIQAEWITVNSPEGYGTVRCYTARPKVRAIRATLPAVLVIHENRGLNPYIADVVRRLATANFIALAPDGLTSLGGYPGNDEAGTTLKEYKKKYTMYQYPNTMHGFHNDTTPRYDAAAAKLAWDRTITFFNENLKT